MMMPQRPPLPSEFQSDRLPVLPHVMLEVMRACHNPALALQDLVAKLNLDAVLAGKVVSAAQAAAYMRPSRVTGVEDAIRVLGTNALKTLVVTLSMQQVFNRFSNTPADYLQDFWQRSLTAALYAKSFATITSYPLPEEAYLAGLIHNIGELVMGVHYGERYFKLRELCQQDQEQIALERAEFGTDHAAAGAWLADIWQFDPILVDAIRYHHSPTVQMLDAQHLTKLVHLAGALAMDDEIHETELLAADSLFGLMPPLVREIGKRIQTEVEDLAEHLQIHQQESSTGKYEELAEELQVASLLQMSRARLLDTATVPDTWARIKQAAQLLFQSPQSLLFLADDKEPQLVCHPLAHQPNLELKIALLPERSRISDAALQQQVSHWWPDQETEPAPVIEKQVLTLLQTPGYCCIPLVVDEQCRGVLVLGLHQPPEPARCRLFQLFGHEVAQTWAQQAPPAPETAPSFWQHNIREAVHEANNPLTIIRNYLEVLAHKLGQEHDVQQDLDVIREELDRTAQILLSLSQSSQVTISPGAVQINQLVRQMAQLFENSLFSSKSIQCHLDCDTSLPLIEANEAQLRQVLTNLLKNAAEALPAQGEVSIVTRDGITFNGQSYIEIQVNDNGAGIPPEILRHLYQPGHSTKGAGHGGLGLSIVHNLMQSLGGFISCRSSHQGTQFQLWVPRKLVVTDGAQQHNAQNTAQRLHPSTSPTT